jgi:hypothetical protein
MRLNSKSIVTIVAVGIVNGLALWQRVKSFIPALAVIAVALVALLLFRSSASTVTRAHAGTTTATLVANGTGAAFTSPNGDLLCLYVIAARNIVCQSDSTQQSIGLVSGQAPYSSSYSDQSGSDFAKPILPYHTQWATPDGVFSCTTGNENNAAYVSCVNAGSQPQAFTFGTYDDGSPLRKAVDSSATDWNSDSWVWIEF